MYHIKIKNVDFKGFSSIYALIYAKKPSKRTFVCKKKALPMNGRAVLMAEAVGFEPTWPVKAKQFSRLPRYDRFDKPPYLKAIKYT